MPGTRDEQIAALKAQLAALEAQPEPEPAEVPAEVSRNPEPEPEPEPEPVSVPELPAFMRQYPEPARGPHLMKSASNETPVLHPAGHAGLGAGASNRA